MAEVTELVTKFSFKGSLAPLSKFKVGLGGAIKKLSLFATATFGSMTALNLWANSIFQAIDPIAQLSRQTGVGVEAIQELGYAAEVNGGSFDAMNKSIAGLNQRIGEAVALGTGEGVAIFDKYGISLKDASGKAKTADVVFDDLRKKIVALGISQREVGSIANKLGLDPSSVQLLMKTSDEMATLRNRAKELGTLTQAQVDATANYNDSLTTLKRALTGIKNELAVSFLPRMQKLSETFTQFIIDNKQVILLIGKTFVTAITTLSHAIKNIIRVLYNFVEPLTKTKTGIAILTVAVASLMLAFTPLTLIMMGIVALVLLIDDLIVTFQGGDSVIGGLISKLELPDSVKDSWQWLKDIFDDMLYVLRLADKMNPFGSNAKAVVSPENRKEALNRGAQMDNGAFYGSMQATLAAREAKSQAGNKSINQNINIDIKTADPERAGIAVQESLQKQLNEAQSQIGNGGL